MRKLALILVLLSAVVTGCATPMGSGGMTQTDEEREMSFRSYSGGP